MSHAIRIKRRATSTVPDDILTNERLSWPARVVLGWMLGRSADFKLHVWHVRKTFRLSEKKWVSLRRNLQQEGYYWQGKERGLNGRFVWTNIVSDQAEFPPPPQKTRDGKPLDGNGRDIPVVIHTNLSITTTTAPGARTGSDFDDLDIEPSIALYLPQLMDILRHTGIKDFAHAQDLLDELAGTIEAGNRGDRKPVGNPVSWLKAVASGKFTRARCYDVQARRQSAKAAAQRIISESDLVVDPIAVAKGEEIIASVNRRRVSRYEHEQALSGSRLKCPIRGTKTQHKKLVIKDNIH